MTTIGKLVCVLAGEPSSAPRDAVELGMGYFLDTAKIRYPADSGSSGGAAGNGVGQTAVAGRRPSADKIGGAGGGSMMDKGRNMQQQQSPVELGGTERGVQQQRGGSTDAAAGNAFADQQQPLRTRQESNSRLPRITGPPQQQQQRPDQQSQQPPSPAPQGSLPQAPTLSSSPSQSGRALANGVATSRQPTRAMSPVNNSVLDRAQLFEQSSAGMYAQVKAPSRSMNASPATVGMGKVSLPTMGASPGGEGGNYFTDEFS